MFFFLLPWKHAYLTYSQLLFSDFWYFYYCYHFVQKVLLGPGFQQNWPNFYIFIHHSLWHLEPIIISPARIPFPMLGQLYLHVSDYSDAPIE